MRSPSLFLPTEMSLPPRIIFCALVLAGCATCGVGAWLFSDDSTAKPNSQQGTAAPARTAWGASPFANAGNDNAAGSGFFAGRSGTLQGRNGRAIDFEGLDAAAYIARWSNQARHGDVAAAYKVYQAAGVCAALNEPLPEFTAEADHTEAMAERARVGKLCSGVSQAQIDERMQYLALAARAGNIDAQVDFFMEGPNGKPDGQVTDAAAIQQWKSDSLAYLKSASQQGDAFATGLLATAYDAGQIVDPDARQSLAYAVANLALRKVNMPLAQLRNRYSQLSDADFNEAVKNGNALTAQ